MDSELLCELLDIIMPNIKNIPPEPSDDFPMYCEDHHDEWRNLYQVPVENIIEHAFGIEADIVEGLTYIGYQILHPKHVKASIEDTIKNYG